MSEEAERRDRLAEELWACADSLGNAKILWRSEFAAAERIMIDQLVSKLLHLGGQVRRGEVTPPGAG